MKQQNRKNIILWGGFVALPSIWSHLLPGAKFENKASQSNITWDVCRANVFVDRYGHIGAIKPCKDEEEFPCWPEHLNGTELPVEKHNARGCLITPGFLDGHTHVRNSKS